MRCNGNGTSPLEKCGKYDENQDTNQTSSNNATRNVIILLLGIYLGER
jgi:hypothetical protein